MVVGQGTTDRYLTEGDIRRIATEAFDAAPLDGKRVLVIIPDGTRTMPMPLMYDVFEALLGPRVTALDYLVALGTHQPMTDEQLSALVGREVVGGKAGQRTIHNHRWDLAGTFATLGTIPAREIEALSGGLMSRDVPVTVNRLVLEYDQILIRGPVFPHEVVGFSGGTNTSFPALPAPRSSTSRTGWARSSPTTA